MKTTPSSAVSSPATMRRSVGSPTSGPPAACSWGVGIFETDEDSRLSASEYPAKPAASSAATATSVTTRRRHVKRGCQRRAIAANVSQPGGRERRYVKVVWRIGRT
jgi:hypothetical protein